MFAQLPKIIKEQVVWLLENDKFPEAKKVHDDWLRHQDDDTLPTEKTTKAKKPEGF